MDLVKKYLNQISIFNLKELKLINYNYNLCKDNLIGKVEYKNGKWVLIEDYVLKEDRIKNKDNISISTNKINKRIIIVLESPHKNEYSKELIAPAMGMTGKKIKFLFLNILNDKLKTNIKENEVYDLIIMNAIQYQASLGLNTKIFRDRIWLNIWIDGKGRENFIERIKAYNPDIIFNFCTKGNHELDTLCILSDSYSRINLENIRYKFIKDLCLSIEQNKGGNLIYKQKVICSPSNINKNKSLGAYKYPLQKFVDNSIEEYLDNINRTGKMIFVGPHPSSWKIKKNKSNLSELLKQIKKL